MFNLGFKGEKRKQLTNIIDNTGGNQNNKNKTVFKMPD